MHLLPGLCSGWRPVSSKQGQRLPSLRGCGAFPNCAECLGGEQEDGLALAGAAELPPQLCMVRGGGAGAQKAASWVGAGAQARRSVQCQSRCPEQGHQPGPSPYKFRTTRALPRRARGCTLVSGKREPRNTHRLFRVC